MTSRFHETPELDFGMYSQLVADALLAFQQDVAYAIQVVESARSITEKKSASAKRSKSKILRS